MALLDVYQQFKHYFGEDKVDLQKKADSDIVLGNSYFNITAEDYFIVVHWPVVTITNENEDSVEIWDLYSITIVNAEGKLLDSPQFIRSTYDRIQWDGDYMHSHISSIYKRDIKRFHYSCLGTGPIIATIERLKTNYNDLDIWNLYCWELDKYVTVESLNGVPYKRLTNLGISANDGHNYLYLSNQPCIPASFIHSYKDLIKEILKCVVVNKILHFSYYDGKYTVASDFVNLVLDISNAFIELYNNSPSLRKRYPKDRLYSTDFVKNMILVNNKLYNKNDASAPIESFIETPLFTFKGKTVSISIKDTNQEYLCSNITALHTKVISFIVYVVLKHVNFEYGRKESLIASDKKFRII